MTNNSGMKNRRILVVDDNQAIHEDFRKILDVDDVGSAVDEVAAELFGRRASAIVPEAFEVDSASQGQEGLACVERALRENRPYAMAFVDVRMPPGWDGIETIRRIWNVDPEILMVICTAYSDYPWAEIVGRLERTSQFLVLKKPFDNIEVRQLADSLTEKWSQARLARLKLDDMTMVEGRTREVRKSQRLLQSTFRAIPDLLTVLDRDLRVVTSNFSGCEHISPEQRESQMPCYQCFAHRDMPCVGCLAEEVFRTGNVCHIERTIAEDGSVKEIYFCPILDESGNVTMLIEHVRDITQRKQAERELQEYARALESANHLLGQLYRQAEAATRAKTEFLANMSHEIRTPMTAILGFAENLLAPDLSGAERSLAVKTIQRNGEHLVNIVNDILDLSKIEAGRLEVENIACSPVGVVDDIRSVMQARAADKGLRLDIRYATSVPETIHTDPTRLRQILINLVGNAIKFTESGYVRLTVSFREEPDDGRSMIRFEVVDTGIGMTLRQLGKLFQPFSQADSSTTRQFGGTGLGLTISKRLASQLGGTVEVESEFGAGSTFQVVVPTGPLQGVELIEPPGKSEHVPAGSSEASCEESVNNLQGRILLCEDAPDNQRLISFILRKAGAEVTIAENGQIALEMAMQAIDNGQPFDLILMDMQMPILDGYEATRRLRAQHYSGPIVALTAHAMTTDRQKCLQAGCDEYVTKPVKRQQLLELVAKYTCHTIRQQ